MPPRLFLRSFPLLVVVLVAGALPSARAAPDPDSLYFAVHPRLAFTRAEVPSLRMKLHDGGADDEAYATIHGYVANRYPTASLGQLMGIAYGLDFLFNLGLVSHLDQPPNQPARELGRLFTLALADSLGPDDNTFYAPIRLRSLCYGYDLCMERATAAERALVRAEIEAYVDSLMFAFNFERWLHPPYTSNITAMIGASLGIAAICLADEMDAARVSAALARADAFVATWMNYHLDPDGTCFEGVQYGSWAMRHLAWYFEARRRYDGVDYSRRDDVRRIERWLAYEVLPEPGGAVNNLNDTAYLNHPLARHNSYIEWALSRWNSALASWLWDRLLGPEDGYDWGELEDHPATALWHRAVVPTNPGGALARAFLWKERGLYYYRTGWPSHGGSDDVVFSFYSGIFHGGHSQSDEGSFTLYAYGSRFAADNGYDRPNWASEAHNLVFVDGKGQHYSGTSVGTDGAIVAHLMTPYADYLFGDATAAYGTHSAYNQPGVPFPDDDWSYGYLGANPVERAHREWLAVHGAGTPPYFVLLDDVKKDDALRSYAWRMHTDAAHTVSLLSDPLRIDGPRGALEIDVCYPPANALARSLQPFHNTSDPGTNVVTLTTQATGACFALVLRPVASAGPAPVVRTTSYPWGGTDVMAWPGGTTDVILAQAGNDTVEATVELPGGATLPIRTDARLVHVRQTAHQPDRRIIVRATTCEAAGVSLLRADNGAVTVVTAGAHAYIDRTDAKMRLHAPGVHTLHAQERSLPFTRTGDFITTPATRSPDGAHALRMYPQPARGAATIVVENTSAAVVTIDLFDVGGRHVRTLWKGTAASGTTQIPFDGLDGLARPLGSGVYFLRARGGDRTTTAKIVLVR